MAIIFMDGFEGLGTLEGPANPITDSLRRNFVVSVLGDEPFLRAGLLIGEAFSFGDSTSALNTKLLWTPPADLLGQTIIVGFQIRTRDSTTGNSEHFLLEIVDSIGERHLSVSINYSDGSMIVRRGNNVLATTSTGLIGLSTKYHIEFKFNIHDSTGLYNLCLDEVSVASGSSVDTKEIHESVNGIQFNGIQASGGVDGEFLLDDFYVLDSTGSVNNDFLGKKTRVYATFPSADGTVNDFTPQTGVDNYAMVNENLASAVDYNDGITNGHIDEYVFDPIANPTIHGLMLRTNIIVSGSTRRFRHRVRSGATVANSSDFNIGDDVDNNTVFENDPDTSSPWTTLGEFGVEVRD